MLRTASLTVAVSKSPGHVFCNAYPWALRPTTERPTAPTYDRIVASPFSTVLELDGISGTVVLDLEPLILGTKSPKIIENGNKPRGKLPTACVIWGVFVGFSGGLPTDPPKKSVVLELASRLTDISRYMDIIWIFTDIYMM